MSERHDHVEDEPTVGETCRQDEKMEQIHGP